MDAKSDLAFVQGSMKIVTADIVTETDGGWTRAGNYSLITGVRRMVIHISDSELHLHPPLKLKLLCHSPLVIDGHKFDAPGTITVNDGIISACGKIDHTYAGQFQSGNMHIFATEKKKKKI